MLNLTQLGLIQFSRREPVVYSPNHGRPNSDATRHVKLQAGSLKIGETEMFSLTPQHLRSIVNRHVKDKKFKIRFVPNNKCLLTRIA